MAMGVAAWDFDERIKEGKERERRWLVYMGSNKEQFAHQMQPRWYPAELFWNARSKRRDMMCRS